MTDFGHWLNKTAKEQQERYRIGEQKELEVSIDCSKLLVDVEIFSDTTDSSNTTGETEDEQLSDYMKRFYASAAAKQGTWDDILETKNNNLEQYDVMQMDTDYDVTHNNVTHNMCYTLETVQDDADLGYGEHYL